VGKAMGMGGFTTNHTFDVRTVRKMLKSEVQRRGSLMALTMCGHENEEPPSWPTLVMYTDRRVRRAVMASVNRRCRSLGLVPQKKATAPQSRPVTSTSNTARGSNGDVGAFESVLRQLRAITSHG
jgi:hypothetical protein